MELKPKKLDYEYDLVELDGHKWHQFKFFPREDCEWYELKPWNEDDD